MSYLRLMCISFICNFALQGCTTLPTKNDEKNKLDVYLFSSADINEDVLGVASPVRVHLLQLGTAIEFNQMNTLSMDGDYRSHLGESVLDEMSMTIRPNSQLDFKLPLRDKAEYLGIVVAYRDLSKNWKLSLFKQGTKWYQSGGQFLYLEVTANGVVPLTKKEAYTKIAEKKLATEGESFKALSEKQKEQVIKQIDKAMVEKQAADLKRGIFIQQTAVGE